MLDWIHRYLDKSSRKTFEYERAANFVLEFVLLAVAAFPIVTSLRSAFAYSLIAALRLFETELRREDASVSGRHAEHGGVLPLPSQKARRAEQRTKILAVVTWVWPGLAAVVQAAESKQWGVVFWVSVGTTLVRVIWGRIIMPTWRKSRVEWQMQRKQSMANSLAAILGPAPCKEQHASDLICERKDSHVWHRQTFKTGVSFFWCTPSSRVETEEPSANASLSLNGWYTQKEAIEPAIRRARLGCLACPMCAASGQIEEYQAEALQKLQAMAGIRTEVSK